MPKCSLLTRKRGKTRDRSEQEKQMKQSRRLVSLLLALLMTMSVLSACGSDPQQPTTPTSPTAPSVPSDEKTATYNVEITTRGEMALPGVEVYVYTDGTKTEMKGYGQTNEYGKLSFTLPVSNDYVLELRGLPKGYVAEEVYKFSRNTAKITLDSQLLQDTSMAVETMTLGSIMCDFSVTRPDGTVVTLSEVLKEKDMVMLNFWYINCSACVAEFPYMQMAYEQYSDDIEIIALNPFDPSDAIANYQAEMGLTFPMASCPATWVNAFSVTGYPTSVVIDRYGMVTLIHVGGITSERPFTSVFSHFSDEDYKQDTFELIDELVTRVKPTHTMDTSENISAAINSGEIDVTYHPETEDEDSEYSWPFIITELNGETCLKASNQTIEDSYAILYADVYLKAGQAVAFDYHASSEYLCDILFVIVDDQDINQISGITEDGVWKSCYPYVAPADGYYELALCYYKDSTNNAGDDTIYVKNMRVVDASEIDTPTYIPTQAAIENEDGSYTYAEIFFNEADGYYHVDSENGPLLLADLMGITLFNEEKSLFDLLYNGDVMVDGKNLYDMTVDYFSYASNSNLQGVCTVNYELGELLKTAANILGFDGTEEEWLKMCRYYQAFGTNGAQLEDPISGLAPFCAPEVFEGVGLEDNYFYYNRIIYPRGLLKKFVPQKTGVYRITSHSTSQDGVEAWLFGENGQQIFTYEHCERMYEDTKNVSIVYYMEAGKAYYIDIAYWDLYENGFIYFDIEYLGSEYDLFRMAAPGYFTYDSDATGDNMYYLIAGGIDVVLGSDGYYHEDLGLDANGNQLYGSIVYADFSGITALFNLPIATVPVYDEDGNIVLDENGNPVTVKGMLDYGAFDFSKDEHDQEVYGYLEKNNFDIEATDAYLRTLWGAEYEANAQTYKLEEIYAGQYHGKGTDMTELVRSYLDKMLNEADHPERQGCVAVTEELAEALQDFVSKYTFANVENAWIKVCYYYQHLG